MRKWEHKGRLGRQDKEGREITRVRYAWLRAPAVRGLSWHSQSPVPSQSDESDVE